MATALDGTVVVVQCKRCSDKARVSSPACRTSLAPASQSAAPTTPGRHHHALLRVSPRPRYAARRDARRQKCPRRVDGPRCQRHPDRRAPPPDRTLCGYVSGPSAPQRPRPIETTSPLTCTNTTRTNAPGHASITPRVVGSSPTGPTVIAGQGPYGPPSLAAIAANACSRRIVHWR